MKYQQRIHEDFANLLEKESDNSAQKQYEKALEQFPQLKGTVTVKNFENPEIQCLRKNNAAICQYWTCESEFADNLESEFPTQLRRKLAQTVRANVLVCRNLLEVIQNETDKEYIAIYKAIYGKYEKYFELAAEDILSDIYGLKYTEFVDERTAYYGKKEKEKAAKRAATLAAKAAKEGK